MKMPQTAMPRPCWPRSFQTPVVIRIEKLTKQYVSGRTVVDALRGIDLLVKQNEYVAVMGPSGSGKSTLMNVLGCLDSPSSGRYELAGQDVALMRDRELAKARNQEIGFVFQNFNLLPRFTALENVELPLIYARVPAAERRCRAMDALVAVGLGDRMKHKPNELSGGQRQRVAVARALVNRPAVILADEPTGNLDSHTGTEVMVLLDQLHDSGNTLVVVTHAEELAARAQRVITLRDGLIDRATSLNVQQIRNKAPY
jgi:putative ABC transport system ATP-binding protein